MLAPAGTSRPVTAQTNRLKALLLSGEGRDQQAARGTLTEATLSQLARRSLPADSTREQAVRRAETRRLAQSLLETAQQLKGNRAQLHVIVDDVALVAVST